MRSARSHGVSGRTTAQPWDNGTAFEHQLCLAVRFAPGIPAGLLEEIRGELERNGQAPWERLGELWGSVAESRSTVDR